MPSAASQLLRLSAASKSTTALAARTILRRRALSTSTRALSGVVLPGRGVRRESSLAAQPALAEESAASDTTTLDSRRILEIADWAQNAQRITPRQTLARPRRELSSNLLSELKAAGQGAVELELEKNVNMDAVMTTAGEAAATELDSVSRAFISDEDVDKWLADFTIPEEQLAKCETPEAVQDLRRRYARQLRLECSVYEMAVDKFKASHLKVQQIGRAADTNAAKDLIRQWMEPAKEFIQNEQKRIRDGKHSMDSNMYGPALLMLKADVLAATGMNVMLNQCLGEAKGPKFIKLALAMGKAVQEEIIVQKERVEKRSGRDHYYLQRAATIPSDIIKAKMRVYHDEVGGWDKRLQLKVGAALIDCIQRSCFVPEPRDRAAHKAGDEKKQQPAFLHDYVFERNRRAGVIRIHPDIATTVLKTDPGNNVLPWTARYLPMLVPPTKWTSVVNGGYLKLHTKIMRQRDSAWQMDCVKRGQLEPVFKSLNLLAEVPWIINKDVLNIILQIWEQGGGFGDLPTRVDLPAPEWEAEFENNPEKRDTYEKMKRKIEQHNNELHSLRCDTLYKLQVAEEFKDETELYFPYNMDFRGRVYPIPPNLNHLGSDLSRSLLIFRDRKPLGEHGLRWMKIHLANVFGVDKCSFDDREAFTDAHLPQVLASAADPMGEGDAAWWKDADYPFLALGVCFELRRALSSPDPTKYESNLPIHQDGSCNGLQHYAALGRDRTGGEQVNLVPGPKPSDVYTGVATQVMAKVERDAGLVVPTDLPPYEQVVEGDSPAERARKHAIRDQWALRRRQELAQFLLGSITRKVVKQTVMTSVYGVTYIGARKQISARLEEVFLTGGHLMDAELEDKIYHASCYAAELTMESMGDLFTSARSIMSWLAECASKVAANGQAMSWITPLGLPVVQPYRRTTSQQIRTKVQHVLMVLTEQLPVSNGRQKSAFPPNFVHSLDSTHMLMTATRCLEEDGLAFAAVHDSYWTHAATVDIMNRRLREEFVDLYEQPLLEELLLQLRLRFPKTHFPDVPKLGSLDLKVVLDSPYFFN